MPYQEIKVAAFHDVMMWFKQHLLVNAVNTTLTQLLVCLECLTDLSEYKIRPLPKSCHGLGRWI